MSEIGLLTIQKPSLVYSHQVLVGRLCTGPLKGVLYFADSSMKMPCLLLCNCFLTQYPVCISKWRIRQSDVQYLEIHRIFSHPLLDTLHEFQLLSLEQYRIKPISLALNGKVVSKSSILFTHYLVFRLIVQSDNRHLMIVFDERQLNNVTVLYHCIHVDKTYCFSGLVKAKLYNNDSQFLTLLFTDQSFLQPFTQTPILNLEKYSLQEQKEELITYSGIITNVIRPSELYELDHALNLSMMHYDTRPLQFGLQLGARIIVTNAHLYQEDEFVTLVMCLSSSIRIMQPPESISDQDPLVFERKLSKLKTLNFSSYIKLDQLASRIVSLLDKIETTESTDTILQRFTETIEKFDPMDKIYTFHSDCKMMHDFIDLDTLESTKEPKTIVGLLTVNACGLWMIDDGQTWLLVELEAHLVLYPGIYYFSNLKTIKRQIEGTEPQTLIQITKETIYTKLGGFNAQPEHEITITPISVHAPYIRVEKDSMSCSQTIEAKYNDNTTKTENTLYLKMEPPSFGFHVGYSYKLLTQKPVYLSSDSALLTVPPNGFRIINVQKTEGLGFYSIQDAAQFVDQQKQGLCVLSVQARIVHFSFQDRGLERASPLHQDLIQFQQEHGLPVKETKMLVITVQDLTSQTKMTIHCPSAHIIHPWILELGSIVQCHRLGLQSNEHGHLTATFLSISQLVLAKHPSSWLKPNLKQTTHTDTISILKSEIKNTNVVLLGSFKHIQEIVFVSVCGCCLSERSHGQCLSGCQDASVELEASAKAVFDNNLTTFQVKIPNLRLLQKIMNLQQTVLQEIQESLLNQRQIVYSKQNPFPLAQQKISHWRRTLELHCKIGRNDFNALASAPFSARNPDYIYERTVLSIEGKELPCYGVWPLHLVCTDVKDMNPLLEVYALVATL